MVNRATAYYFVAGAVFLADRFTKKMVMARFQPGESINAIPGLLEITRVHNTGIAFGLGKGWNWAFAVIALAVIAYLIWKQRGVTSKWTTTVLCGLVLGGAIGNLWDRLIYGYVLDFINLGWWPAFNVADSALSIGALGLAAYFWKK